MAGGLEVGLGLIHAESVSFALAETMPRADSQAIVMVLCDAAVVTNRSLTGLVIRDFPERDWSVVLYGTSHLGQAPAEARAFAKACC